MPSTTTFDQLFAISVGVVFAVFALRCLVGACLYFIGQLPSRWSRGANRLSAAITPRLVRRLVVVALGVGGSIATTGPAFATEFPNLDRGSVPASAPVSATPPTSAKADASGDGRVRVEDGDCLWSLAQEQLPPAASPKQIDKQSQRWYSLNRERIGSDPDLIRTGQWLRMPSPAAAGGGK